MALQTKHGAISESYLSHICSIEFNDIGKSMNTLHPGVQGGRVGKLNAEPDSLPTTARFLKWRTI